MKFVRRIIAAVMVAAVSLTTLATTAFAWGKDLVALSDDERFDVLWKEVEHSYIPLEASLMHDELKKFVSELELETKIYGYDVDEGFKDFKEWYEKRHDGEKFNTYNETVISYLREHPGADLSWTGSGWESTYTVYDSRIKVYEGKHSIDEPFMQYDPNNIDDLIIWTYNSEKNQYEGNDLSGKMVKKVSAYSVPYSERESSKTSEPSNTSSAVEQDESEDTEVSELHESYAETSSVMVDDPIVSEESVVAVEVSDDKSETVAEEPREESAVKASNDTAAASEETVEADTSMVTEKSSVEEESSSNDNSTTTIIIICGAVIVGVFTFLIVRQKKKKV